MSKSQGELKITDTSLTLSDLRWIALCCVYYVGFSVLVMPHEGMLTFSTHNVSIFSKIRKKSYQFLNEVWIVVTRSDMPTCPIKASLQNVQINLSDDLPQSAQSPCYSLAKENVRAHGIT